MLKNRRATIQATPPWTDRKIQEIYRKRRELSENYGVDYEVDHVVSLLGSNVCEFHVDYTLRIIPRDVNRSKSNKFKDDDIVYSVWKHTADSELESGVG